MTKFQITPHIQLYNQTFLPSVTVARLNLLHPSDRAPVRVALIALIAIGLVSHALIRMYASELVIFARARPPLATASAAPPLLRGGYGDTPDGGGRRRRRQWRDRRGERGERGEA